MPIYLYTTKLKLFISLKQSKVLLKNTKHCEKLENQSENEFAEEYKIIGLYKENNKIKKIEMNTFRNETNQV